MKYEVIGELDDGSKLFGRVDDDGLCRVTCTEENPEYQAWLNPKAEQSTPIDTSL
jgi:hypothetical protein